MGLNTLIAHPHEGAVEQRASEINADSDWLEGGIVLEGTRVRVQNLISVSMRLVNLLLPFLFLFLLPLTIKT